MGRGVIDLPLSKIATEIRCVESTHIWDKFLVVSVWLTVIHADTCDECQGALFMIVAIHVLYCSTTNC